MDGCEKMVLTMLMYMEGVFNFIHGCFSKLTPKKVLDWLAWGVVGVGIGIAAVTFLNAFLYFFWTGLWVIPAFFVAFYYSFKRIGGFDWLDKKLAVLFRKKVDSYAAKRSLPDACETPKACGWDS